jgi:rhodanese-related sulfurtransferase
MKGLLLALLVAALILTVGCPQSAPPATEGNTPPATEGNTPPEAPTQIIKDITVQEASTLIKDNQDNPDFVILDVRTPDEFAGGHIADAVNLDYQAKTFRNELKKLDKDKTYLVYCASGGRSASAVDVMKELGFMTAYNMRGGISKWKAEGLPTTKWEHH